MASIDLTLQPLQGRDELAVLVVSPASQAGFTAPRPAAPGRAPGALARCSGHWGWGLGSGVLGLGSG